MNTDDKIEQLIREIASKHGIAVARDDPILVLQTINHRLLQDSVAVQQAMLEKYREELEVIANRWSQNSHEKAERVLNLALENSREMMAKLVQAAEETVSSAVEEKMKAAIAEAKAIESISYQAAFLNFSAASLILCAVVLTILFH